MNLNTELKKKIINCPHCSAEWNGFEIDQQECLTCGWPDPWDATPKPQEQPTDAPQTADKGRGLTTSQNK